MNREHEHKQGNLDFKGMAFLFKIRDFFKPPKNVLKMLDIKEGSVVLDYGCGPGSFSIAASEMVGNSGKVFSADINPLAIESVKKRAAKKRLNNIKTINTDTKTELEDDSIDYVILFDMFHAVKNKNTLLQELHRVLKPGAWLFFSDHHIDENRRVSIIENSKLFIYRDRITDIFKFQKL